MKIFTLLYIATLGIRDAPQKFQTSPPSGGKNGPNFCHFDHINTKKYVKNV